MLMSLGPIRFEIYPFNATDYEHGHESGFVEKPVLGARPPLEWVPASLFRGPDGRLLHRPVAQFYSGVDMPLFVCPHRHRVCQRTPLTPALFKL